jgi:hypothetical protein
VLARWRKRFCGSIGVAAAACVVAGPGLADHQPTLVIPAHRGVPVFVNGVEVSGGAVIEGDWGLYRPGHGSVIIYPGDRLLFEAPAHGSYYPATGRRPRSGRYEIEPPPNRRRPPPAQSYSRRWTAESPAGVVTTYPPTDPPLVIEAVPRQRWKHRSRSRPHRR